MQQPEEMVATRGEAIVYDNNYTSTAARGVHVAVAGPSTPPTWTLRQRCYTKGAFGKAPPDLLVDLRTRVLSFVNRSKVAKAFFVSVRSHRCSGAGGAALQRGIWRKGGTSTAVTTFIVNVAAGLVVDVCKLKGGSGAHLDVYSDIVPANPCAPSHHGRRSATDTWLPSRSRPSVPVLSGRRWRPHTLCAPVDIRCDRLGRASRHSGAGGLHGGR